MRDPYTDLEINCRAQLSILGGVPKHNRNARVVFAGTRQGMVGRTTFLSTKASGAPADINGVNKAAGEYTTCLQQRPSMRCSLRLTNVYGRDS